MEFCIAVCHMPEAKRPPG